ncbi:MAG: hypothetical protein R6W68_01610 [Ignavibacteriaceae bacterium]
MKIKFSNILFLLVIISILSFYRCSSGTQTTFEDRESDEQKTESTVEKSAFISVPFEKPSQQSGYYFMYRFKTSDDRIYNIIDFLTGLSSEGFDIAAAWYFAGPNCGNSKTIYHPQLMVQLKKKDLRMNNYNFVYLTDKLIFKCTESTEMYVPQN